jgi:hypothetical protein
MRRAILTFIIALNVFAAVTLADEGMWPLDSLDKLPWKDLRERGLKLSSEEILALKDAVVLLGGGTGSFVSPQGLVITNHHVAYGAIQFQSTARENFIANGFLAKTREEELPAPGYTASVLVDFRDVTREVLAATKPEMSDAERQQAIDRRRNEIAREAEKRAPGLRATVVDMLSGKRYMLYVYQEFKDVRLVYAPPASVGEYGGEIDNWMWPRHTGDFSFMRVYAGPDGNPAPYSKDNVPYRPKRWLKLATKPVREGDFVMVLGYPGTTMRYRSSYSIAFNQNVTYPRQIAFYSDLIRLLEEEGNKDPELRVRFASRLKGLYNSLKYMQGMVEGLKKTRLVAKKQEQERQFQAFLQRRPDFQQRYGDVLPSIEKLYRELSTYEAKQAVLGYFNFSTVFSFARTIWYWADERAKPPEERDPGFNEEELPRVKENFQNAERNLHVPTDKRILALVLRRAAQLPEGQRIQALEPVLGNWKGEVLDQRIERFVDSLYAGTKVIDLNERLKMLGMTKAEIEQLGDPLIRFAAELRKESKELEDRYRAFSGAVTRLRGLLIEGFQAWRGGALYPDANRTLRLTYGTVCGYSPRDAVWYKWATTLRGVVEKDTGEDPFDCPEPLKEIAASRDYGRYVHPDLKDVMVNFLADLDITGGNSGSPVLNGKGELVGVAFDGNYEAMTSDFVFDPDLTRAISVNIGYVLFIADRLNKAENVLRELGVR